MKPTFSGKKLYLRFLSMHLRTAMEYKASFLMTFFGMTLTSLSSFLAIWLLFDRFWLPGGVSIAPVYSDIHYHEFWL